MQQQLQQQQQQIHELQLQQEVVESDDNEEEDEESDSDDEEEDEDEDEDDDSPVMNYTMYSACYQGDVETIASQLDAGKSVNCVEGDGMTPVIVALRYGHLNAAIVLAGRGADLMTLAGTRFIVHQLEVMSGAC
jgi:ankyrin repeat protein